MGLVVIRPIRTVTPMILLVPCDSLASLTKQNCIGALDRPNPLKPAAFAVGVKGHMRLRFIYFLHQVITHGNFASSIICESLFVAFKLAVLGIAAAPNCKASTKDVSLTTAFTKDPCLTSNPNLNLNLNSPTVGESLSRKFKLTFYKQGTSFIPVSVCRAMGQYH